MPNDAYGGWTPLRNALRKLDLNDTLGVIRAYSAFRTLRTRTPFPTDMEVHPSVYWSNIRSSLHWLRKTGITESKVSAYIGLSITIRTRALVRPNFWGMRSSNITAPSPP